MKRSLAIAVVFGAVIALTAANAGGPFDQKLSPDRQVVHALNRLAFGPRPGDIEEVNRVGLAKWIDLQLHPDQITENPTLEARLKPLESLGMPLNAVVSAYTPQPQTPAMMTMAVPIQNLNQLLPQTDVRAVQIGTAEERTAILKKLDPEKRKQVLAILPNDVLDHTPEFKQEGEEARRMQQEDRVRENRMRNPQLADILSPDQMTAVNSGNKDQLTAVLAYLDPTKRQQVINILPPQRVADFPELRRESQMRRSPRLVASEDLKEAKVLRAIYSNRQLEEVLVDFWVNHFNVDVTKNVQAVNSPGTQNLMHLLLGSYERDAIRPHVLGHFKDLLLATAQHPAMLYYLDNWESLAPGSFEVGPFAPRRATVNGVPNTILPGILGQVAHGLNENYGREVMELHTLGVKGGYTQDDVIAVARCFTGWTVTNPEEPKFVFAPFMHDMEEKTVLGHKIPAGGGMQDGVQVIDILAHHPSTAKFISRELAQRFVADDPPQALVDRMAQTFTKTDGDLRAVLQTMFASPEFFSDGAWQSKIKSPFEMVVSAVRAVQGDAVDTYALVQKVADLGEPLYSKLAPTGYPNTGEPWLSTQGVMGRMNFSASLASGLVSGVKVDAATFDGKDSPAIARTLLGRDASPQTLAALQQGLGDKPSSPLFIASLVLGSPDFQRR